MKKISSKQLLGNIQFPKGIYRYGWTQVQTARSFSTAEALATKQPPVEIAGDSASASPPQEVKQPMTFGKFMLYALGTVSGAGFSYYFYKSGFDLHKTEISITKKLAELPFYYPPGPDQSEKNSTLPRVALPQGLVDQLSAWFIHQDTKLREGVRRNDVLDLFAVLGLVDPEKEGDLSFESVGGEEFRKSISQSVTSFINRGRGRLPEFKRQSGVSIQETIELLDEIMGKHHSITPSITETVESKLHEILGALVEHVIKEAVEPQAGEKELIEMELAQLERARRELQSKISSISEAEEGRIKDLTLKIQDAQEQLRKL